MYRFNVDFAFCLLVYQDYVIYTESVGSDRNLMSTQFSQHSTWCQICFCYIVSFSISSIIHHSSSTIHYFILFFVQPLLLNKIIHFFIPLILQCKICILIRAYRSKFDHRTYFRAQFSVTIERPLANHVE